MMQISLLWAILLSLIFSPPLLDAHPDNINEQKMLKKLEEYLDGAANGDNFSGVIIIAKDGQVIFKKAVGYASKSYNVPNNIDTKFNMASVGKLFTSVAIAQLAQEGKLSLDDPVSKYLSDWLADNYADEIKIRDLLIHTSGLGNFFDNEKFKLGDDSGLYIAIEDYKPLVKEEKLAFTPGTSQLYSNTGYLLLGAIIEKISGKSYFDYIQEHIFDPANMMNSGYYEMDDPVPNLAIGFNRTFKDGKPIWKNNLFENVFKGSPAGGGFSTAGDMLNFYRALYSNKLLNPEYTRSVLSGEVEKPKSPVDYIKKEINVLGHNYEVLFTKYGFAGVWNRFGLEIYQSLPLMVGHSGGLKGVNNNFVIIPDNGYMYILFGNYTGEGTMDPRNKINEFIIEASKFK